MTRARLVVFDMDGTLIDSQHVILAAMARAFGGVGRPPPSDAEVLGIVGLSLPEAMAALLPGASEAETLALAALYREDFAARRETSLASDAPLYPGARDALERLAARPETLMGVATGKARPGLEHVFASHDLARYFVTSQTADAHPSKPHPSMLLTALAETGCEPETAVMVGDTEFDIAMGRAAGFSTIGVAWGYHDRPRLEAAGADVLIGDFDALDAALEALWVRMT